MKSSEPEPAAEASRAAPEVWSLDHAAERKRPTRIMRARDDFEPGAPPVRKDGHDEERSLPGSPRSSLSLLSSSAGDAAIATACEAGLGQTP